MFHDPGWLWSGSYSKRSSARMRTELMKTTKSIASSKRLSCMTRRSRPNAAEPWKDGQHCCVQVTAAAARRASAAAASCCACSKPRGSSTHSSRNSSREMKPFWSWSTFSIAASTSSRGLPARLIGTVSYSDSSCTSSRKTCTGRPCTPEHSAIALTTQPSERAQSTATEHSDRATEHSV